MTVEDVRRLTQEELLAEAKITEQINLKSLGKYGAEVSFFVSWDLKINGRLMF